MDVSAMSFQQVYQAYEDYMLLKNYSPATINTYLCNFRKYHEWCKESDQEDPYTQDVVRSYLLYRVKQGARWQTMNNIYSAMRKLFREVIEKEWSFKKLPRPKKERQLPELLSQQDILRVIQACPYFKHQAILVTLYATGLRSSELCHLKLMDIDAQRLQVRVRKGKGAKDRYVIIPGELISYLRAYYRAYKPKVYLFNGRTTGKPICVGTLRWPINQAKKKLGFTKKVSPHTLRHCYATHHLESGTDLVFLQQNMGHKHLKTTARYIHLCKHRYQHIKHPIADMMSILFPQTTG